MSKVYRVNMMMLTVTGLKAFEFVKETDKTIWYMDNESEVHSKKYGAKYRFYHTFEEAKDKAISNQSKIVEEYRKHYVKSVDCLDKLKERTQ